ncbi:hypothetical protein [Mesorhizobium neociceri]|uniref:Uncharacterized protein n=1 Tax=Mesorhizobium neociceri TaxID=1307853 RepID=A0A838BEG4_9HYPH|nr:hypothetical protein [Mesorhizobium neociceri]MBA1143790.1 hypothetical protein [Mesorhizobium neociceri]
MDIAVSNEIVAEFLSQENVGLAIDNQNYAGDLVDDFNIDAAEWIRDNFPDADEEAVEHAAQRIEEKGPWVYTDTEH